MVSLRQHALSFISDQEIERDSKDDGVIIIFMGGRYFMKQQCVFGEAGVRKRNRGCNTMVKIVEGMRYRRDG